MVTKTTIDNFEEFIKSLEEAGNRVSDLTIPLTLISREWYKSNRAIFNLKSHGKYPDYKVNSRGVSVYKNFKIRKFGTAYPMLKLSGRLEKAITVPGSRNSLSQIINKKELFLGVFLEDGFMYPLYLQEGTQIMEARPPILYGAEQTAPPQLNRRVKNWTLIVQNYVAQVLAGKNGSI